MTALRWPRFAAAALGLLWFLQLGDGTALNPLNVTWLFSGDWRQHWLGFMFFQKEPWTFPLGELPSLLYPIGTNIGFTDSNPLLALLAKPFAAWLPGEFQLIGPWLALCFALQGYTAAALTSTVTRDPGQQLLGAYLIVLSPVLVVRLGHDTLCAHWILLGLLYLGLRQYGDDGAARRAPWWTVAAVAFSAAVHPYLAAMAWVLAEACLVRLWIGRIATGRTAVTAMAATTAALFAVWGVIGYFGRGGDLSGGFGTYSAGLLTLFDPQDLSRLLPDLPSTPGEYEGIGFLGLGGVVAALISASLLIKRRPAWRDGRWVPVGACVLLAGYAVASHVRVADKDILNLEALYEPLMPLIGPFRSSGRFIWPLHYLVSALGVWGVVRVFGHARKHLGTVSLALVVILQASDLKTQPFWRATEVPVQIATAPYESGIGHYKHMALAPMQVLGACFDPYQEDYVYRFMLLAHRLGLTFNSGVYARLDVRRTRAQCDALERAVDTGTLNPETIYVVAVDALGRFKNAGAACGRWDGHWVCVSGQSNERFRIWIETGKDAAGSTGATGSTGSTDAAGSR